MFERFTDRARQTLVFAPEIAREMGHSFLGTEHILLGLLREGGGIGARALVGLGLDEATARRRVEEAIPPGAGAMPKKIPFTPRSKKVLENALREALTLGHNYIGTEHLLLGLIRSTDGVAAQVLVDAGIELETVRAEVLRLVEEYVGSARPPGRFGGRGRRGRGTPPGPGRPPGPAVGPRPAGRAGGSDRRKATPAGERVPAAARARAGEAPVASHDYLLALLDDPTSSAARVLASFGVTPEAAEARLADLGVADTSDEVKRAYEVDSSDSGVTIRITDPDLAEMVRAGGVSITFELPARDGDGPGDEAESALDTRAIEDAVVEALVMETGDLTGASDDDDAGDGDDDGDDQDRSGPDDDADRPT